MPSKRRTTKRRDHAITPEAVAAFRRGDRAALHRALGLKPWHPSPLSAEGEAPWSDSTMGAKSWALVVELRAELIEAMEGRDAC
jgi:hypothetical protein